MTAPISFTDRQITVLMQAAGTLPSRLRPWLLTMITYRLRGISEPTDDDVDAAIVSIFRRHVTYPDLQSAPDKQKETFHANASA